MRKRTITIALVCFFMLILTSCGKSNKSEIITLSNAETQAQVTGVETFSNVLVYKTKKVEEYLTFLENFDERNNDILGVIASMYTGVHTSGDFYMVTYKKLDELREDVRATGKVSLFKTTNEEEFRSFLSTFDVNNNEILGITTSMYTGVYTNGDFYTITFRELK